tara:strand:- start:15549 stop:15953 length:405 start_codon:yes stop_codon:yes gene_type:complete
MKYLAWSFGVLVSCVLIFAVVERMAAERVEVVELHAKGPSGEIITTRLWIVDEGGKQYLRVGADGSGWFSRLEANNNIQLTRGGETRDYRAVPDPTKSDAVNRAMQDKYTWGDTFIGSLFGGRQGSIPIELVPN